MPKVSILMITYNRADYIEEAIKSALKQSFSDFEIIVMDDASTDNTEEIIKNFQNNDSRIKYWKQNNNSGIVKNRNDGISHASGEYLAILDSDDIWLNENKLKNQVVFLDKNIDHSIIGTQTVTIDEDGKETGKITHETEDSQIRSKILLTNQFVNSSVLMKLSALKQVGFYSDNLIIGEDYDLFLKMGNISKFANLSTFDTAYRIHQNGITKQRKLKGALNHLDIIKKYKNYPNYFFAIIKSYLRIIIAKIK